MKKKVTLVFLLLVISFGKFNAQVTLEWAARYNSSSNGSDYVSAMALDSSGNVYVLGSDSDDPPGPLVLKYNSSGQLVWRRKFTDSSPPFYSGGKKILVDLQGNVYVGGGINGGNYLIIKYNSFGDLEWYKTHRGTGGGRDELQDIKLDEHGNISLIASGYIKNNSTNWDVGTIKYNTSGHIVWVRNYDPDNSDDQGGFAMAGNDSTNITITGFSGYRDFLTVSYDFEGTLRWAQTWDGPANRWDVAADIASDKNGNTYVTGYATMDSTFDQDIVTIKYDNNGNQKWVRFYDGAADSFSYDQGYLIKTDSEDNIIVTGKDVGATNSGGYCTIKYDSLGNFLWVRRYDVPGDDFPEGLAVDKFSSVYVTGTSINKITTIKYDKDGNQVWLQKYPDSDTISGVKVIMVDENLNVYIAGTISFNPSDIIVLKYSQPTSVIPVSKEVPDGYKLYQNYPNPFNSKTNIKYQIPAQLSGGTNSSYVRVVVYDVFGREVVVLVNEKKEPGEYQVEWEVEGLASGLYYYRMISGKYIETKKALLIK